MSAGSNGKLKRYSVELQAEPSQSYFAVRAANSVDLDVRAKLTHRLDVQADFETDFHVGLILGNSGSGKSTLAREVWGADALECDLDFSRPIIDQLPEELDYDARAALLSGIGLTSVPCWIKPVGLLSNGQQARAISAYMMANHATPVIDEWSSVVDRSVARAMSHCVQKYARRHDKRIVLLSCHSDVVPWLNPCWILDLNTGKYSDRRLLWRRYRRKEALRFEVRTCERTAWRTFAKYHYLGGDVPGGLSRFFGLYLEDGQQVGICIASNYIPRQNAGDALQLHISRIVMHPDYQGLGVGGQFGSAVAEILLREGFRVRAKFSNRAAHTLLQRDPHWLFLGASDNLHSLQTRVEGCRFMSREAGFRLFVRTYQYEYIGADDPHGIRKARRLRRAARRLGSKGQRKRRAAKR